MAFIGFDVYGTLVDPLGMDAALREHVGDLAERFAATWRERQIDWTFRRALMGRYVDFDVVTRDAFRITAATLGVDLRTAEPGCDHGVLVRFGQGRRQATGGQQEIR